MAPTVGRLVEIIGGDDKDKAVTGLVFRGLTFRGGDWSQQDGCGGYGMGTNGVLYLKNAVGCTIADCRFTNLGKDAVCAEGGGGHTIRNNDITDSAEGGININGAIGNHIVGNHIHHCGQVYKHNGAVTLQNGAAGNLVSGNMIHDMTRYGITMKLAGHDNVIEYNRVLNTSLETYDTGAIEVTQQDREDRSGTKIRYNIVGDCVGYSSSDGLPYFLSWGIYLDSFAGGYEVTNNLVYRNNNGGIMFQGGKDNRVTNNIFVDGRVGQGHISNFADNQQGCALERNVVCFASPDAALFATGRIDDKVITVDHNVYWCSGATDPEAAWRKRLGEWQQRGLDVHSVAADPRFVDAAHDDYQLRPDSPAYKLGFVRIDTSKIAPLCRCRIVPQGPVLFETKRAN